ncbi:MAG: hypothetical protein WC443_11535, partial [Desulfobaccales bacterium]
MSLALLGCATFARPGLSESETTQAADTAKSLAYFHFLKAQQLLVADDVAGATQEYEEALKNDPDSPFMEMEVASLYQRQGDVKKA